MDLCGLFRALGDPIRFRIVEALTEGPRTVSDIVEIVGAPQPNVSRHLKSLREGAVISSRRRGKWIEYSINGEAMGAIRKWLSEPAFSSVRGGAPRAADEESPGSDDAFLFGG